MKKSFKLLSFALCICLIGIYSPRLSSNANAQVANPIAKINVTTLDSAHFKSGSFKKNTQGDWDEFDQNNNIRFTFKEILRDKTTVYLRHDTHNVSIELNDATRIIYASWPGKPRHEMHRITSATITPPHVENPIAPAPPLTVTPPSVSNPIAPAPIAPSPIKVKPSTVTRAVFKGGEFIKSGENWTAKTDTGQSYKLVQLGYDKKNVYLLDANRNGLFILDIPAKIIRVGKGSKIKRQHKVTKYSADATPPPSPAEPHFGKPLPELEAVLCKAKGGKVEQVGMLGHERCTMSYSDANMACTDSDQCQGQCRSTSHGNNESNVIGQCQATDNPFGCFTEVKNGKTTFGLCVD